MFAPQSSENEKKVNANQFEFYNKDNTVPNDVKLSIKSSSLNAACFNARCNIVLIFKFPVMYAEPP